MFALLSDAFWFASKEGLTPYPSKNSSVIAVASKGIPGVFDCFRSGGFSEKFSTVRRSAIPLSPGPALATVSAASPASLA